ncbi:MAG: hypothetical protein IJX90_11390 [Blautia sp.]|nr:hypothetical protein [Blautia sp.]
MKKRGIFAAVVMLMLVLAFASVNVSAKTYKEGWVKVNGKYVWRQTNGTIFKKKGFQKLGGNWYYLWSDGTRCTGWRTIKGNVYYFSKDSKTKGIMALGLYELDGKSYYFNPNKTNLGKQRYGFVTINNKKYYFRKQDKGAMLKNAWFKTGGKRYRANSKGQCMTGLHTISGVTYYFDSTCAMVTDKLGIKIKGKYYAIDENGACTEVSEALGLAGIQAEACGRNLKKCFTWSATTLRYASAAVSVDTSEDLAEQYAVYGFKNKKGDCNVQAATFYMMAKVLGQKNLLFMKASVATGKNADGTYKTTPHAWVEQTSGSKTYFYDPNAEYQAKKDNKKYTTYKFEYGASGSFMYIDEHNHTKAA